MSSNVGLSDAGKDRRTRMHGDILFQSTRKEGWCRRIPHLGRRQGRDGLCFSPNVSEQSVRGSCARVCRRPPALCTSLSEVVLEGRQTLSRFGREACSHCLQVGPAATTHSRASHGRGSAYRFARAVRRSLSLAEHALLQVLSTRCPLIGQLLGLPR